MKTKRLFAGLTLLTTLLACSNTPSEGAIQTEIAETQLVSPQATDSNAIQFVTDTPTSNITPTYLLQTPIPTNTATSATTAPTPLPTAMLNTPPGTVLYVGEAWYTDGVELRLTKASFDSNGLNIGRSCYIIRLEMANWAPTSIYFRLDKNEFWVTDNLRRRYEMEMKFHANDYCSVEGYGSPLDVSIESGQRISYAWLEGGWNMQFYIPITEPNITSLNFHVGRLERIANAEWYIPIR